MAYIRKRGKTWYYTVDIGKDPVTGDRLQDSKGGFRTKREAEIAAARVEAEVASGTFVKETKATFEEQAELWMKAYKMNDLKPATIRRREFQIKILLKYFAKLPLPSITRKRYREAIYDMCTKYKRKTVVEVHAVARAIFRMAVQDGDLKNDPTEYVKVPIAQPKEELPKYMEKEQLAEFLHLTKHRGLPGDYPFFLLLAYTGMRIGEACALRWSDVNFDEGTISINGTLYNPTNSAREYEIVTPKTTKSCRTVDVDEEVLNVLAKWKSQQNVFRMKYRNVYHDGDFVFGRIDRISALGYPPTIFLMENRMDRILKWMNLPYRLTPHALRHTHVSLLAEAGASLPAIMDRIGHEDGKITKRIYLHVTKTMKKSTSEKFSALMRDVVKL